MCQDLLELRYMCAEVFHQWLLPVREGRIAASDTAQLFRESTPHLRRALKKVGAHDGPYPNPNPKPNPNRDPDPNPNPHQVYAHDGSEKLSAAAAVAPTTLRLPTCAKYLLLAAHLASRFPARMDVALFSSIRRGAKQRRTKRATAHDEPRPFTLERLLTTYAHIQPETELQPLRVEVRRWRGTLTPSPPSRTPTSSCNPLHVRCCTLSAPPHLSLGPLTPSTYLISFLSPAHILYPIPTTPLTPPVQVLVQLGTLIQQQLVVRVSSEAVLEGMRLRCEAPQDTLKAAAEELKFDLDRYFEDVAGS